MLPWAGRGEIAVGPLKYVPAIFVPLIALLFLGGAKEDRTEETCGVVRAAHLSTAGADDLDAQQMRIARTAVGAVRDYPLTRDIPRAAVIVLAAAYQESGLRNLDYGDRDSLGFLQQRPSQGWGTPAEVRDVAHATRSFLDRLVQVPGWRTRRVTDVAADVQRPAEEFRGLYEQWVPKSEALVSRLWGDCDRVSLLRADGGQIGYPVPDPLITSDRKNWGGGGGRWSSWHTGTDFSVACGTPVLAVTAGTVLIDRSQAWAGPWLVKISTGPGRLTTWYAHMQRVDVTPGQQVEAGQRIGEVGALGNATGCHLHFEVHLAGGSIYGPDNTDPSLWLAHHLGKPDRTRVL